MNNIGWTALHYGANAGAGAVVFLLLSAEALVEVADLKGWTPFYAAVRHGHDIVAFNLMDFISPRAGSSRSARPISDITPPA